MGRKEDISLREFSSLKAKVVGNHLEKAMKVLKKKMEVVTRGSALHRVFLLA
jgi:hypothetical protein